MREFRKGDRVFSVEFGHGSITKSDLSVFSLTVRFDSEELECFTSEGRRIDDEDVHVTLFHANTGPITFDTTWQPEYEVDTPLWVSHVAEGEWSKRHFSHYENGLLFCFSNGRSSHTSLGVGASWAFHKKIEPEKDKAWIVKRAVCGGGILAEVMFARTLAESSQGDFEEVVERYKPVIFQGEINE